MEQLSGIKVAILVTHGFEQSELLKPKEALEQAGALVEIVSPENTHVKGWHDGDWGIILPVDVTLDKANPKDYDALVLPGGVMNPDTLRINEAAINFIKFFVENNRPIGAICHGLWPLINAKGVANKTVTSWPSLKEDLTNAQAKWVDRSVVRDGFLVTSRMPADLPDFNAELIKLFARK